jgi:predicted MFS family arabinose efflux permease
MSELDAAHDPMALPANPWAAVWSVALSAAVFCTTEFLPVGTLRYISEGLNVSEGTAGIMVTAPGLLAAIAAPALTVAVGSRDRRLALWALGALLVASNVIGLLAPNFGVLIGGPAGALIGDLVGWRAAFGGALVLSILSLAAQLVLLPPLRVRQRVRPRDLLGILATREGRVGLIAMFLVLCGQFGTYTYITPFLAQVSGFDGKSISSILLGYTLIGLLGNFLGGAGAGRNLRLTFLATIVFFAVPVLLLPVLGAWKVGAVALLAVWGLAYGAMPIALQMWMVKAAPDVHEGGMALFVANFQVSIALGSLGGGLMVDTFGLARAMVAGGAVALLAVAVIWLFSAGRARPASRNRIPGY